MTSIPRISLNEEWRYRFASQNEAYFEPDFDDSDWEWTLFDSIPISNTAPPEAIWLRKHFDLLENENCIRYFLKCTNLVYPTQIYLRGTVITSTAMGTALELDVTDHVTLNNNVLVLAINASQWDLSPQTEDLYLQPVFCDDLD